MKKVIALSSVIALLALLIGCPMSGLGTGGRAGVSGASGRGLPSGQMEYQVTGNPLINQKYDFTSDPAATVVHDPDTDQDVLLLVTSSDYADNGGSNFKMDKTYLFGTTEESLSGTIGDPGIWYGPSEPVIREESLPWLKGKTPKRLYAPDIQFVSAFGGKPDRIMIYVPDFVAEKNNGSNDPEGRLRIGMAETESNADSLYGAFTPAQDFFQIKDGAEKVPNAGYAYDPGIFLDEQSGEYFMAYCNTKAECHYSDVGKGIVKGTLGMVKVTNKETMNEGEYLGLITFRNAGDFKDWKGLDLNAMYEEGPDINIMTLPGGERRYYLIFAAKVVEKEDEYIGYATKTEQEFRDSPLKDWNFQGWMFKDLRDKNTKGEPGWTNHSDLVQYKGRTYVFFHKILPGNNARSACCKEIELRDDGKIVGVERNNYDALDPFGAAIGKGFFYIRDDSRDDTKKASIRISYFTNKTGADITDFTVKYYLNVEPNGRTLVVENVRWGNYSWNYELEHIYSKTWAVVLQNGGTFGNGQTLPDISFDLRYKKGETFDKANDFSQPGAAYNTWSSRMGLFAASDNANPRAGDVPYVDASKSKDDSKYLSVRDPNKGGYLFYYLTCLDDDANAGIASQALDTGWTSQEWMFEQAGDWSTDPRYVRIRNLYSNYYMTCNNVVKNNSYFFILSQALNKGWASQVWIREPAKDKYGYVIPERYTLRSCWIPESDKKPLDGKQIFLTTNNIFKDFKLDVYGQPRGYDSGGYPWSTQHWRIQAP
jgi:hypothetical protein